MFKKRSSCEHCRSPNKQPLSAITRGFLVGPCYVSACFLGTWRGLAFLNRKELQRASKQHMQNAGNWPPLNLETTINLWHFLRWCCSVLPSRKPSLQRWEQSCWFEALAQSSAVFGRKRSLVSRIPPPTCCNFTKYHHWRFPGTCLDKTNVCSITRNRRVANLEVRTPGAPKLLIPL